MRYITPRKAAQGLGSAHSGTQDHWFLTVTSCALVLLARGRTGKGATGVKLQSCPVPGRYQEVRIVTGCGR